MSSHSIIPLPSEESDFPIRHIVIEQYRIAITISLDSRPATPLLKTIRPGMRHEINHRIFGCRNIVGTIHIIYVQRLFPRSHQSFIIEWSYFIYFPVSFIRLAASGIVMTAIYPLELSANTISCLLRQTDLSFHQPAHAIFTPRSVHLKLSGFRMQSDASPCTIFSVQ